MLFVIDTEKLLNGPTLDFSLAIAEMYFMLFFAFIPQTSIWVKRMISSNACISMRQMYAFLRTVTVENVLNIYGNVVGW